MLYYCQVLQISLFYCWLSALVDSTLITDQILRDLLPELLRILRSSTACEVLLLVSAILLQISGSKFRGSEIIIKCGGYPIILAAAQTISLKEFNEIHSLLIFTLTMLCVSNRSIFIIARVHD